MIRVLRARGLLIRSYAKTVYSSGWWLQAGPMLADFQQDTETSIAELINLSLGFVEDTYLTNLTIRRNIVSVGVKRNIVSKTATLSLTQAPVTLNLLAV